MLVQLVSPRDLSGDEAGPTPLSIDVSRPDADTVVVTPTGEADYCTVACLRQALSEATGAGPFHVIVDLDRLTFIDASVLNALVEARLRIFAVGGTLQVRCHARHGRRLLTITRLNDMLDDRQ